MNYEDYLMHFNPNHDPRNGQFTSTKYQTAGGDLTREGQRKLKRSWHKAYNTASEEFNRRIRDIDNRYPDKSKLGWDGSAFTTKLGQKYIKEVDDTWRGLYISELRARYPEMIQNGERWMSRAPYMNMYYDYVDKK